MELVKYNTPPLPAVLLSNDTVEFPLKVITEFCVPSIAPPLIFATLFIKFKVELPLNIM